MIIIIKLIKCYITPKRKSNNNYRSYNKNSNQNSLHNIYNSNEKYTSASLKLILKIKSLDKWKEKQLSAFDRCYSLEDMLVFIYKTQETNCNHVLVITIKAKEGNVLINIIRSCIII